MPLSSDISPTPSRQRKLWRCSRKKRRLSLNVKHMLARWGKFCSYDRRSNPLYFDTKNKVLFRYPAYVTSAGWLGRYRFTSLVNVN